MEGWMRKRAVLKSVPDLWQHQYLLLDYVNNNAFSGVMNAISLDDLTCVIKDLPDGKAAGLSGISNKLWKHCDSSVLGLFLNLLNICLKEAWVSMISKPYEWEGVLTNTKLNTLIETACKIFSKLLFNRILSVYSLFNVLHGNNFSVLKGTTTQSPIFAIGSVVKDALKKDCELWLVLQNMHKAYDFRIFYDLLLCKIKRQASLCKYQIDTKFVAKTSRIKGQDSLILFLAASVLVDNTILQVNFLVNNISINNKKTVAIPINQKVGNTSLLISGLLISIAHRKKSHQYLGIYLLSEGLSKPSLAKMHTDVRFFVNLVFKKAILDKQFLYLVSAVLQSIVNYRTQFSFVSRNVYTKDFPNKTLYHPFLYDLKSFEQLQTECKVASVLCFSNAGSVLGRLFNYSPVNNFLAGVIRIFLDYNLSLDNLSVFAFCFLGGTPISTILEASLFYNKTFYHWKRLDLKGSVPWWFTLTMDVCSSGAVFRLGQYLSSANMGVVSVYTDGSLGNLDLDLGIGAKVGRLVSLTMVELQAIALALVCVPSDSSVVVYSDSQTVLDVCVAESALVSPDFHNCCWIKWHSIINLIRGKRFNVSWHKIKRHSDIIDNEHADELASLVANSSLALPVLVKKRFIKAGGVSSGFNVIDDNLLGDVDWFCTALVWHSNSYMATGFISKSMAGLHSYFLKTFHHCLLIAVWKHLYSKVYPSVSCLYCGKVESSDHFFVCMFDSVALLSLYTSDNMLYTAVSKGFVFRDWVQEALFILSDAKVVRRFIIEFVQELGAAYHMNIWLVRAKYRALMKKDGLILFNGSVYSVTHVDISSAPSVLEFTNFDLVCNCLLGLGADSLLVYTNRSLAGLSTLNVKSGVAVFFDDINMGLSIKVSGLLSSTLVELQAIALALECVPAVSKVSLFSDSQTTLNACSSGNRVVTGELLTDIDWRRSSSIWHPDSHMAAGFTSIWTAGLCTYFMKALHHRLPVAVCKRLYDRSYPSVVCLFCGSVEVSDHVFSCDSDFANHDRLLGEFVVKWKNISGLRGPSFCVLQTLSSCILDTSVCGALCKSFVFNDWFFEAVSVFGDLKLAGAKIVDFVRDFYLAFRDEVWLVRVKHCAFMKKHGLIPRDGSVPVSISGLSSLYLAGVVRLLGIDDALGIKFGLCKFSLFVSGALNAVSVHIGA
ncbi:hypothetical protein G9A89_017844 [Geosiphon pyriformis]|nr:hypothetical protein G9A89_017844 [Geosiphon pyriformis]